MWNRLLHSFGTAGHYLAYGVLVGSGVALLGLTLARASSGRGLLGWTGVGTGAFTAGAAVASLLVAPPVRTPGFAVAVLSVPATYLWALAVEVRVSRN